MVTALAPWLASWALRLLGPTLRVRREESTVAELWATRAPVIYVVWHARLLVLPYLYRDRDLRERLGEPGVGERAARVILNVAGAA